MTVIALNGSTDGRARVTELARTFLRSAAFAGEPSNLPLRRPLRALLKELDSRVDFTLAALARRIGARFGAPPAELAASAEFRDTVPALADGALALAIAPADHPTLLENMSGCCA